MSITPGDMPGFLSPLPTRGIPRTQVAFSSTQAPPKTYLPVHPRDEPHRTWTWVFLFLLFIFFNTFDALGLDLCFFLSLVLLSHPPQSAPSFAFRHTFPEWFLSTFCPCPVASALSSLECFPLLLCSRILVLLLGLLPLGSKSLELVPYSLFHQTLRI